MLKKIRFLMFLLVLASLPIMGRAALFTHSASLTSVENKNLEQVAKNASSAVVLIKGYKEVPLYATTRDGRKLLGVITKQVTAGSGFFISPYGYIITNNHVVDDANATYTVDTGSKEVETKVVYSTTNP